MLWLSSGFGIVIVTNVVLSLDLGVVIVPNVVLSSGFGIGIVVDVVLSSAVAYSGVGEPDSLLAVAVCRLSARCLRGLSSFVVSLIVFFGSAIAISGRHAAVRRRDGVWVWWCV